jgi:hypothetical protein
VVDKVTLRKFFCGHFGQSPSVSLQYAV